MQHLFFSEFTADRAEYAEVERGRISGNARMPYFADFTALGCALYGGFSPRISLISRMKDSAF
jgi:hypothetical protein